MVRLPRMLEAPVLTCGCALACAGGANEPASVSADATHPVLRAPDRPALVVVEREADPTGAVALAVLHEQGSLASLVLGEVIAARVASAVVHSTAHSVIAVLPAANRAAAQSAFRTLSAALQRPIVDADRTALARANQRADALPMLSDGEAAIAACGDELHRIGEAHPVTPALAEAWRRANGPRNVAFAVVGTKDIASGATSEFERSPRWSDVGPALRTQSATPGWNVASRPAPAPTLRIGVRLSDASRADALVDWFGSGDFSRRATAWPGNWQVQHIAQSVEPRTLCTVVELQALESPSRRAATDASVLIDDEVLRVLGRPRANRPPPAPALPSAPGAADTAALAARQVLRRESTEEEAAPRTMVFGTFATDDAKPPSADDWVKGRAEAVERRRGVLFELRGVVEKNQAGLGILLATPCPLVETPDSSGATAAMLQAAATEGSRVSGGVEISPWLGAFGTGLFAYSAQRAGESRAQHAARVAAALGEGLARAHFDGASAQSAVESLTERAPGEPSEVELLRLLSGDQTSRLSSSGTLPSLMGLSPARVEATRREFLTQPLRVSVLAPGDESQFSVALNELRRDLWPLHEAGATCPSPMPTAISSGSYSVRADTEPGADAAVGVVLAPHPGLRGSLAAQLVERWFAAPGGLLERHVTPGSGLLGNVEVELFEGTGGLALTFLITAGPEQETAPLVEQLRALLQRLPDVASDGTLARARSELESDLAASKASPMFRARSAWLGKGSTAIPSEADVRSLLALLATAPVIVLDVRN